MHVPHTLLPVCRGQVLSKGVRLKHTEIHTRSGLPYSVNDLKMVSAEKAAYVVLLYPGSTLGGGGGDGGGSRAEQGAAAGGLPSSGYLHGVMSLSAPMHGFGAPMGLHGVGAGPGAGGRLLPWLDEDAQAESLKAATVTALSTLHVRGRSQQHLVVQVRDAWGGRRRWGDRP